MQGFTLHKTATIHQVATMLATSKNTIFPDHNHLLSTGTDDPTLLIITLGGARAIISVRSSVLVTSRWLWPENRTFLEVATWWIVVFCAICSPWNSCRLIYVYRGLGEEMGHWTYCGLKAIHQETVIICAGYDAVELSPHVTDCILEEKH